MPKFFKSHSSVLDDEQDDTKRYDWGSDEDSRRQKQSRKNKEIPFPIFIVSLVFVLLMTGFLIISTVHVLPETKNAVVTYFGNPRLVNQPGVFFTIPFIEVSTDVDITIHGMAIGYTLDTDDTISKEATMITEDFNFLDIFFYLEYQVSDPIKYLYASQSPEVMLSDLFQSAIRDTVGSYETDAVLTSSRYEVQEAVTALLTEKLEQLDIGLVVKNATIQDVGLPTDEIKKAFDSVESAKTNADKAVTEANTYYDTETITAAGIADELIRKAQGEATERINEAEGQVARFESMYEQYLLAPEVTKLRMYYEAMEIILPEVKVIITNGDGKIVNVFTEPYASNTSTGTTTAPTTDVTNTQ